MLLTLITPTRNRPQAFNLCQRWMEQQDYSGPVQWIVVNDGAEPYNYTAAQQVVLRDPSHDGPRPSLNMNLLAAFPLVLGDAVAFIEDDDWFHPSYLSEMVARLDDAHIAGTCPAIYYNIHTRRMRNMNNVGHASTGQTILRREALDWVASVTQWWATKKHSPYIDMGIWKRQYAHGSRRLVGNAARDNRPLHVSVKGMPGQAGIGYGHRMMRGATDPDGRALRRMLGRDADAYLEISHSVVK